MGNSLKNLGRYQKAITAYNRAIELEPDEPMYLCNKGRLLQLTGNEREALDCFNRAYEMIQSNPSRKPTDAAFVEHTLSHDREELLKKVIDLQEAALDTEEWIGVHGSEETKEEASVLRQDRETIVGEFLSGMGGSDTGVSRSDENAELVARLNMVMAQYDALRAKVDGHAVVLADHDVAIMDIQTKIDSLELSQKEMKAMVKAFQKQGIKDTDTVLSFLADLKADITGATPEHIAQDPYANAFYNSLQRDLNATYIAAMSVQTEIVENSKKSIILGNVASILNIAGQFIPTLGGGVLFLGAVLNAVDQRHQDIIVKRFAEMATGPSQMEKIAANVAEILAQDGFDKSLLHSGGGSAGAKITEYLISFLDGLSGGSTAKAAASSAAMDVMYQMGVTATESTITKTTHTKSKFFGFSIFKKKAADAKQEEVKTSNSADEKSQGEKDAHMVSAIIISKIYKGDISADGRPVDIAKTIASIVLQHFDLDTRTIELIMTENSHHAEHMLFGHGHGAADEEYKAMGGDGYYISEEDMI